MNCAWPASIIRDAPVVTCSFDQNRLMSSWHACFFSTNCTCRHEFKTFSIYNCSIDTACSGRFVPKQFGQDHPFLRHSQWSCLWMNCARDPTRPPCSVFCHLRRKEGRIQNAAICTACTQCGFHVVMNMHQIVVLRGEVEKTFWALEAEFGAGQEVFKINLQKVSSVLTFIMRQQWLSAAIAIILGAKNTPQKVINGPSCNVRRSWYSIQHCRRPFKHCYHIAENEPGIWPFEATFRIPSHVIPPKIFFGEMFHHWSFMLAPAVLAEVGVGVGQLGRNASTSLTQAVHDFRQENRHIYMFKT